PFSNDQIALVETFADQAVIAIENARLFDELQEKSRELEAANTELREALERQTATSEVLGTIAGSPTDVNPVLDTIVRRASALGEATYASVWRLEGDDLVRWASTDPTMPGGRMPITDDTVFGRA